jgi:formate dehydrogenase subunit beta
MMIGLIPTGNTDALTAVRSFLRMLMERGALDILYVPLETETGAIVPALITDPARIERANPLAPVMPINGARAVSALTGKGAPARLGAVLRPCEARALIELVKLQQASLDNVTLIGMDCPGTCEVNEYVTAQRAGEVNLTGFWEAASKGEPLPGAALRPACQMCTHSVPEQVGIQLQWFGADLSQGIPVELEDEIAAKLEMIPAVEELSDQRKTVIEELLGERGRVRESELAAMQGRLSSDGGMAEIFATCIRCHNCMTACPICYCKTCLFKTAAFDHSPEQYLRAAQRKGALRMLSDAMLFQMTRLNHMGTSCVSCGMCTSACPSDIPVGAVFSTIGSQVQAVFEYVPGRDVAEPLPLITFQADEWTTIGE